MYKLAQVFNLNEETLHTTNWFLMVVIFSKNKDWERKTRIAEHLNDYHNICKISFNP